MKKQAVLDIECYKNYFLVMFYFPEHDKYLWTEQHSGSELNRHIIETVLKTCEIITFNGNHYDMPVLSEALRGRDCLDIRRVSDCIIVHDQKPYQIEKMFGPTVRCDHVDLIEVAFGQASLKVYGGRLGCQKLQDLPIDPNAELTRDEMIQIREYCKNDVLTTAALLNKLKPQIDLRRQMSEEYGVDLRSKSDAQIAEAVICKELSRITGATPRKPRSVPTSFIYSFAEFLTQLPFAVEETVSKPFVVKGTGAVEMPKELADLVVTIGGTSYQMGMGGIHSMEKSVYYKADDTVLLCDFDVTSYYPSIILNLGLYPEQMGPEFLTVYRRIVEERVTAKYAGDKVKADALKIVVNGSFGKFGSKYSALYSPNLLVQVTLTGQLSLLMLIGWLEGQGIQVVSANTDGIVCRCPVDKESLMLRIVKLWEGKTGFTMERTDYSALYSRDVNNYIAIKGESVKTKGVFGSAGMSKNPQNEVCSMAVIEYLKSGASLETTIKGCTDINNFLTLRTVKGGAVKAGYALGKAVRWYYGVGEEGTINYKTNGNKVPRSDGAIPLMNLPDELPNDIDYEWYINEAQSLLGDLGL